MPKLIFISGLGADETVFQKIRPVEGFESVFIPWKSINKKYTLTTYAKHLVESISINNDDVIIGLSFGGLIAIELAQQYQLNRIVLLSSFRDKRDLKLFIQPALSLRLYRLIPNFKLSNFSRIFRHYFNLVSGEGEAVLSSMLNKQDPKFTKWAMHQMAISNFKSIDGLTIYNIIGTKDRLVKNWKNENTHFVEGGGHFMVFENAEEINEVLIEIFLDSN